MRAQAGHDVVARRVGDERVCLDAEAAAPLLHRVAEEQRAAVTVHDGRGVLHHPNEVGHCKHGRGAAGIVLANPLPQLGFNILLLRRGRIVAGPAQNVVTPGRQVLACPRLRGDIDSGTSARLDLPGPGSGAEDRPSVGGKVSGPVHPAISAVDLTREVHHARPGADPVGLGRENVTENLDKFQRTEPTQPVGESKVHRGILSRGRLVTVGLAALGWQCGGRAKGRPTRSRESRGGRGPPGAGVDNVVDILERQCQPDTARPKRDPIAHPGERSVDPQGRAEPCNRVDGARHPAMVPPAWRLSTGSARAATTEANPGAPLTSECFLEGEGQHVISVELLMSGAKSGRSSSDTPPGP